MKVWFEGKQNKGAPVVHAMQSTDLTAAFKHTLLCLPPTPGCHGTAMTAPSLARFAGLSLSDELAEATNELLDLGTRAQHPFPPGFTLEPLPTPSPLSLSAGGLSLGRTLAVDENARMTLIYDDDDERPAKQAHQRSPAKSPGRHPEDDEDDRLPSSRLNRMVDAVSDSRTSNSALNPSPSSVTPEQKLRSHTWYNERGESVMKPISTSASQLLVPASNTALASSKVDSTPAFFLQSFPDARGAATEASTSRGADEPPPAVASSSSASSSQSPSLSPFPLRLPFSEAAKATLSNVDDAAVTVQLHGNRRLEKLAEDKLAMQLEDDDSQSTRQHSEGGEDGDSSSLLSLPATSVTGSSQMSSKVRRRPGRRRSTGSASMVTQELDTLDDDIPFARDVLVRGFNVVGEKSRGFVCYDVRVITTPGTTISILRRFSSFLQLRQSLASERPMHASLLPPLPPKRTGLLHKYASHHLEKRRRALQRWLVVVMLDRRWGTTKSLREWVVGNSDDT